MNKSVRLVAIIFAGIIDLILLVVGIYGYLTGRDLWGWWFIGSGILLFFIFIVAFNDPIGTIETEDDEDNDTGLSKK